MFKWISLLLFMAVLTCRAEEKGKIIVEITGFENNEGQAKAALHNIPEAYPMKPEKALLNLTSKIENKKAVFVFKDIPYGEYAISIHHDEDGDNEVDTNFIGIPSEDFGASNNAKGSFGPPSFEDAKITLNSKEMRHKIKIQ